MYRTKVSVKFDRRFLESAGTDVGGTLYVSLYRVCRCIYRRLDMHEILVRQSPEAPPERIYLDIPRGTLYSSESAHLYLSRTLRHTGLFCNIYDYLASEIGPVAMQAARGGSQRRFALIADVVITEERVIDEAQGWRDVCIGDGRRLGKWKEVEEEDRVCVICLEEVSAPAELLETLCGHLFHKRCIFAWLERGPSCPVCRRPVSGE